METAIITKTYKYTPAHKKASKKYYDANREDKIIKALERYKDKYNNDEEFRIKRKEFMRQYQQKKREEKKNTPPENS